MFKIRNTLTILAQCKQEKVDGDLVLGVLYHGMIRAIVTPRHISKASHELIGV